MAYDVTTRAGGWVAAQAARRWRRASLVGGVGLLATIVLVTSTLAGRTHPLLVLGVLAVALVAYRIADSMLDDAVHWRDGARAEGAVGDLLDTLRPEFVVMHDLRQLGEGNVDHLVSGPSGVFMIETKARRYPPNALRKAKRQAAKLGNELEVWVTPVICIHERRGSEPFNHHGVWIVSSERLPAWLRTQRNATLPFERLARFADSL
ncbi:MAG TPA: nuclease-related domain-containing protein [Gaiellaceae bacterium]|nr:nuclease-related domain-containing protein [Gaiellaceae bacterium]